MYSISIGEILYGWNGDYRGARIFLIRDDKLVFFVGLLQRTILDNLLKHCGLIENGPPADRLGKLILDNSPSSNGWMVDLLSLEDCEPIVREVMSLYRWLDAARVLFCLTSYYGPYLVEKDNPEPVPLPERYKSIW
jgi:hypothetical protein